MPEKIGVFFVIATAVLHISGGLAQDFESSSPRCDGVEEEENELLRFNGVRDEPDDFYEFTPEDYYHVMANKMGAQFLKTRKIREAEEAKRRAKVTKTWAGPLYMWKMPPIDTKDGVESCQHVRVDTTPPKEQIKDMLKDFYSAGFAPGAFVYFSYGNLPRGDQIVNSGPFLRDEILSLNGLDVVHEQSEVTHPATEPVVAKPPAPLQETKAAVGKKPVKPKWLKL
ncbi:hypothetical protein QJS04_geneDACA016728 [Acorus gramineus]|uniref:Uncharacterized protein n=1 Tax=Acorus gramineus TaxID=55184 RepID=A0AAV9ASQ6_ACOGR|nr:hypothetical protein QJS04_geneDACA016728 [Acorus gramineus]